MGATRALSIEDRLVVPGAAFDLEGYRTWVKSEAYPTRIRTAYIDGEVSLDMSPESLERHNKVKTALTADLAWFVRERDLGEVYSDRTLLTHEAARLSTEPDLIVVSWASFEQGHVRRVEKAGRPDEYIELVGSPDLVAEVVSDASARKDTVLLRDAYALAGVREYWLIDARGDEIDFQILLNEEGILRATGNPRGAQPSLVLGECWTLTRTESRAGHFAYRLAHNA